jgi:hypothetical protein
MFDKKYVLTARPIYIVFATIMGMLLVTPGFAADKKDMGGWELNSPYNKLYNPSEMDRIKGTVEKIIKVVPMSGMSPGVAIILRESKTETIMVHLCPIWYIDQKNTGLKKGDKVKIRGVWAEVNDEYVFMASKIKKGDYFQLKVRLTKDGKPFWTMSPEEEAREKASQ